MPVQQQMQEMQRKAYPPFKKMNAEEEGLSVNQRLDLTIADRTVEKMMGPEPIPSLDIEMDEIQNQLQRKMVEELQCVICGQFPYKPLECSKCNKLFCKYCQMQLGQGPQMPEDFVESPQEQVNFGNMGSAINKKMLSAGRDGRQNSKSPRRMTAGPQGNSVTPDFDFCCPNCQSKGDFMQPVNKVLQNCIDFCEFPHRCPGPNGKGEVIWKTLGELQIHAQFHCPKFGCDICYRDEYQHMTRAQLYEHIKRDCPEVQVMCQICNKEYSREQFSQHQCIKDFYIEKLKANTSDVLDNLADKLILHRRQKEGIGLCRRYQCVEEHRNSGNMYNQPMIVFNPERVACEDNYTCIYCQENYSPVQLGYAKNYVLEEMEQLLMKFDNGERRQFE